MTGNAFTSDTWEAYGEEPARLSPLSDRMPWWPYVDPRLGMTPAAAAAEDWSDPAVLGGSAYRHLAGHPATRGLMLTMHLRDELDRLWQAEMHRIVIGDGGDGSNLRGIVDAEPWLCPAPDDDGDLCMRRLPCREHHVSNHVSAMALYGNAYRAAEHAAFSVTNPDARIVVKAVL